MCNEDIANEIVKKFMQTPILSYTDIYNIVLFILEKHDKKSS